MSQMDRPNLSKWARWGLLAITLTMGAALISTAWVSRRRIDESSQVLIMGQAELLLRALGAQVRSSADVSSADLATFLAENEKFGVRYVELRSGRGDSKRAGTPAGPLPDQSFEVRGPFRTTRIGERVRLIGHVPLRPPARSRLPVPPAQVLAPASPALPASGEPPSDFFRTLRLSYMVLEFEPVVGNRLQYDARWAFIMACVVAGAFLLVTASLWRMLEQRECSEARAEQERRLAMLGEMSAVLAHEIRNPLASLKGHAQLLSEQLEGVTAQRRKADRVVLEAKRIEELCKALLDFVKSGSIEPRLVNPRELVSQSSDSIDACVQIDATEAPETWPLDPLRMRQVFTNLLENAAQASMQGQPIDVRIFSDKARLTVTIRDRGAGIPDGEAGKLFQAFHTTRTHGVGLGLAVARRIVELHGGSIAAANHPDGGALFSVSLPRAPS